jgi:hypothetical protein
MVWWCLENLFGGIGVPLSREYSFKGGRDDYCVARREGRVCRVVAGPFGSGQPYPSQVASSRELPGRRG